MTIQGCFGYIIGKKKRLMYVEEDADILWQTLVREISVLMKHYQTKDTLKSAFETIKTTKSKPNKTDIEKYKIFTNFSINQNPDSWNQVLHHCQKSFINILEAGYIINQKEEIGLTFLLDFNKGCVSFYGKAFDGKKHVYESATLEEIMEFEDMPSKPYIQIICEMKERFRIWHNKYKIIVEEIERLFLLKQETKKQGASNIEDKLEKMIDDLEWQKKDLIRSRREFYHRLKSLDLIEEPQPKIDEEN